MFVVAADRNALEQVAANLIDNASNTRQPAASRRRSGAARNQVA